jgi:hypothetical protein
MKTIKIAFYHGGGSIVDKAIQLKTSNFSKDWRDIASHVEISLEPNYFYSMDTSYPFTARKKEMGLHPLKWRTYEFEVTDVEYKKMRLKAESILGAKYDWLNIFGSDILPLGIGTKSRYTCDEYVAVVLQECLVCDGLKELNKLNPHSLEEYINDTYTS